MTIAEILKKDGILIYKTKGSSMEPMLHENRDVVVIRAKGLSRAEKGDVVLYTREGKPDYVLHRVVRVGKEGYVMMGDHQFRKERIPESAVIGVLTSFIRNGREIPVTDPEYLKYVATLSDSSFLRFLGFGFRAVKRKMKRLFGKDGQ